MVFIHDDANFVSDVSSIKLCTSSNSSICHMNALHKNHCFLHLRRKTKQFGVWRIKSYRSTMKSWRYSKQTNATNKPLYSLFSCFIISISAPGSESISQTRRAIELVHRRIGCYSRELITNPTTSAFQLIKQLTDNMNDRIKEWLISPASVLTDYAEFLHHATQSH